MIAGKKLRELIRAEGSNEVEGLRSASLELKIGNIHIPPTEPHHPVQIFDSYEIPVGGTVVVETRDELEMPQSKAGLMFPKSSALAEHGILITNFGLVDPGYKGRLRYALINLGRSPFLLRKNAVFVHLTVFDLGEDVSPFDNSKDRQSATETARRLAYDFVDVTGRATQAAKKEVWSQVLRISVVLSLTLIVPSIFIALAPPFLDDWLNIGDIGFRITEIEGKLDENQAAVDELTALINCMRLKNGSQDC